jgi:antibiotic biosynthesis monooxygenase (ABM) superfamily enzyme
MFGTIARAKIRPENRDKFRAVLESEGQVVVPGYVSSHLMFPEGRDDEAYLVVFFDDRDSYMKNADDPAQDERYQKFRALLEEDPEWMDGDWVTFGA